MRSPAARSRSSTWWRVYAYYDCIDDDTDIYYGRDSDVPACRDDAAIDNLAA